MTQHFSSIARYKRVHGKISARIELARLFTYGRKLFAKMKLVRQISIERHSLSCLSDHQLRDIGLTRDQVDAELGRSAFDIAAARYDYLGNLHLGVKPRASSDKTS